MFLFKSLGLEKPYMEKKNLSFKQCPKLALPFVTLSPEDWDAC